MALMQLTVFPLGTGSPTVGEYVVEIQKILARQKLPFVLTDMGTTVQGETRDLLDLAARLAEAPFSQGAQRVVTQITIDDRRDKDVGLGEKIASVEARLQGGGE